MVDIEIRESRATVAAETRGNEPIPHVNANKRNMASTMGSKWCKMACATSHTTSPTYRNPTPTFLFVARASPGSPPQQRWVPNTDFRSTNHTQPQNYGNLQQISGVPLLSLTCNICTCPPYLPQSYLTACGLPNILLDLEGIHVPTTLVKLNLKPFNPLQGISHGKGIHSMDFHRPDGTLLL